MPNYLDDVEEARNRPDKSVLAIRTMHPEKLLVPDVAFPHLVKHLWLDVRFDRSNYCQLEKLYQKDCSCPKMEGCNLCSWNLKYNNILCKDFINFNQLETLVVCDLNLRSDLWIRFAQNSKCLREIVFTSNCGASDTFDEFCFDGEFDDSGDHKEKALEAILKIPTLKKASFLRLELPFFPKGPSNIDHLELYVEPYTVGCGDKVKYDYTNFSSHINFKSLDVSQGEDSPLPFYSLQFEKLINLEELVFHGCFEDKKDIDSLKKVLNLPKLKDMGIILFKNMYGYIKASVILQKEKWIFETENNKVTVDSKEEVLKLIETFELTLTN